MVININLHIEELVLHGFAPRDRYLIADAVKQELRVLLAERSATAVARFRAGDVPRLDVGSFRVAQDANSKSIGVQVARAVHGGLMK